jgi:SAM-dependent methyltransferase
MLKAKFLGSRLAYILGLESKRRTKELIATEYDQGIWLKNLKRLRDSNSLEDYLFGGSDYPQLCRPGTYKTQLVARSEYLRAKAGLLHKLLSPFPSVCELGCGSGWNLIALRYLGFSGRLSGIDISPVGIQVIIEANAKWSLDINVSIGDITSQQTFKTALIQSSGAIFTFLALEQLPREAPLTLTNLYEISDSKSIFLIESASGLFPLHYSELLSILYTKKRDYLRTLRRFFDDLSIPYQVRRLNFSPVIGNDVALWEIVSKAK